MDDAIYVNKMHEGNDWVWEQAPPTLTYVGNGKGGALHMVDGSDIGTNNL